MAEGLELSRLAHAGHRRRRLHRLELRAPAPRASSRPAHVTVLDALTYAGNLENLDAVTDDAGYVRARRHPRPGGGRRGDGGRADVVLNFAAESHVDRSIDEREGRSSRPTCTACSCCWRRRGGRSVLRFVQVSTDEVYGEMLTGAATEESPLLPRNPYAASKAGGDRLAYAYYATYGLPVVVTRCSNNYGPHQYPEKLVPLFVTNALEDKPLPVYGNGLNTARLDPRRRPLPRADRDAARAGRRGRDLQHRRRATSVGAGHHGAHPGSSPETEEPRRPTSTIARGTTAGTRSTRPSSSA